MIIIGHRGAKGLAPENTVKAIEAALTHNVDMIEVDLRLHDNKVVLSHDQTLHLGEYCLLKDALAAVKGKVPLVLEVKELRVVNKLKKIIETYKGPLTFSSKSFEILKALKLIFPKMPIAVIEKWSGVRAVAEASLLDTTEIHINHNWLWSGFVRSMKHRGYTLFAYTVNSRERAEELESWGIDGIFTDRPDKFIKE